MRYLVLFITLALLIVGPACAPTESSPTSDIPESPEPRLVPLTEPRIDWKWDETYSKLVIQTDSAGGYFRVLGSGFEPYSQVTLYLCVDSWQCILGTTETANEVGCFFAIMIAQAPIRIGADPDLDIFHAMRPAYVGAIVDGEQVATLPVLLMADLPYRT